jgi:LmbE family N-acetylglucosaminyl deacetylase
MRLPLRPGLRRSLHARLRAGVDESLNRSAVVFAPHQDDETLGCGGTIILKRQLGIPVTLVFMTDGSTSHRRFVGEDALREMRNQEALDAAEVLGLTRDNVRFLNFPDGRLADSHDAAVEKVRAILEAQRPDEVFVPYHADRTPDHEATYRVIVAAIQQLKMPLRILEYPVWIWNQWPWVSLAVKPNRETIRTVWRAVTAGLGASTFDAFDTAVFVNDVLPQKRSALECHRSQMTEMKEGVDWPTLGDVSNGDFLASFFQEFEIFRCQVSDESGRLSPVEGRCRLLKGSESRVDRLASSPL